MVGLTQAEFSAKVRKGLGQPSMSVRQLLGDALVNDFDSIWLRYEWIKDQRFWRWASSTPEVDFDDGEEWIRVFRCLEDRVLEPSEMRSATQPH